MTVLGLSLVLLAACCHATWNYLVKRVGGGPELIWLFSIISALLYLPLAVAALATTETRFGATEIGFIVGSALLHLGYFLLLQQGYRRGDLSLVYPTARATGPLLSSVLAVVILGEMVSLRIVLGGVAIVVGGVFLTGGFTRESRQVATSALFGIGAGLLIGSYTVWDAHAVSVLLVPPLVLDYASSLGRSVLLAPVALRRKATVAALWREHRSRVIAIAVFNPLAYILVLYALEFTPVVYVAPLREVSVLISVVIGHLLLGEPGFRHRMQWAFVILVGVSVLATG